MLHKLSYFAFILQRRQEALIESSFTKYIRHPTPTPIIWSRRDLNPRANNFNVSDKGDEKSRTPFDLGQSRYRAGGGKISDEN